MTHGNTKIKFEDVFVFQTQLAPEEARSEPRERKAKVSKLSEVLGLTEAGIEQSDNTD